MVDAAKEELANARLTDDEEVLENAEKRLKKAERDFEMDKRTVRDRFANEAFFRKHLRPLNSEEIYRIEDFEDEVWVTINTSSRFFMEVYQRSTGYPEMQSLLDLMIFSLALGEANKYNSPEMKRFWEQSRKADFPYILHTAGHDELRQVIQRDRQDVRVQSGDARQDVTRGRYRCS